MPIYTQKEEQEIISEEASEKKDARFRDTRKRIIAATFDELVEHGVAGARLNRIAELAGTSKERVYAYFKDKEALVEAVVHERMLAVNAYANFDARDLVGYVGKLFDFYAAHPSHVRLSQWLALDQGRKTRAQTEIMKRYYSERVEQMRQAQADGLIDSNWDPLILLNMLVNIAMGWATAPRFVHLIETTEYQEEQLSRCRASAVEAARRLITPNNSK